MATKTVHRLTAAWCAKPEIAPGRYPDGGGLYLQITGTGGRSWIFRYKRHGRVREMGLGSAALVSLKTARERLAAARSKLADDLDPLAERRTVRKARRHVETHRCLFTHALEKVIAVQAAQWKGGEDSKHAAQWRSTLKLHAETLMHADVADINTASIIRVLEPIWKTKPETASRIRQRIEIILEWCRAHGYRTGDNPARFAGHLEHLLGEQQREVKHHASLPYSQCGEFIGRLREQGGTAARALEMLVLCASRTGEVAGATWGEIDLDAKTWTIPAARMKAKRPHRVPLSSPAVALLETIGPGNPDALVFPSPRGKVLSDMAMAAVLVRMGHKKGESFTCHGFRSSIRTWITETTSTPVDVAEAVLAHEKRGAVQQAYERSDFLEQRRPLMQRWADYLSKRDSGVLPFASEAAA